MDNRNCDVTNIVFEILNNVKGFDVAMSNPRNGKIIVRHEGLNFLMTIEPIFNDDDAGKECEKKPFTEVVENNFWLLR